MRNGEVMVQLILEVSFNLNLPFESEKVYSILISDEYVVNDEWSSISVLFSLHGNEQIQAILHVYLM